MKRLVLTVIAVTALVPAGTALAHHGRHHHRHHVRTFAPRTDNSNIGTVKSFDGTTLVITPKSGADVSGTVTDATRIRCDSAGGAAATRSARLRDHGDDNDANDDRGDDNGADNNVAEDQGDDNGDDNDAGDDNGNDNGDDNGRQQSSCSTADLTPGAVVHRAKLELTGTGATWENVQLVK